MTHSNKHNSGSVACSLDADACKGSLSGKRVLLTGSRGFIGRHLAPRLIEAGAMVTAYDGDILDWPALQRISGVDLVYHLAAVTPQRQAIWQDPRAVYMVNLNGTGNLLEVARLNNARFVFASSYVYGPPQYLPIDEQHPVNPTSPYAHSKYLGEEMCRAYHRDFGLCCLAVRAFNVYGHGQPRGFLIPDIVEQIWQGGEIVLQDPNPRRDYVHIDDLVDAYLRLGGYTPKSGFEVFNVGSGESFSVRQLADRLLALAKKECTVRYLHCHRRGEIPETVAASGKIRGMLGWHPRVDIDTGLAQCLQR